MSAKFDSNTKLGDIFTKLNGRNLTVEDMDLPVRVYNMLKRAGIHNLQQLLSMSEDDIINTVKAPRNCSCVIDKLQRLSDEYC